MPDDRRPPRTAIHLPVDEVTLVEDRAHVVRRGRVELEKGLQRVVIERVAPVIVDKTLTVEVLGEGARAVDARVARRSVFELSDGLGDADEPDEVREKLERQLQALRFHVARLEGARHAALRRATALDATARHSLAELVDDVGWDRDELAGWIDRFERLRQAELAARLEAWDEGVALDKERRAEQRLTSRIRAVERPDERARADLHLDVLVERAGGVDLRVDYIVPNACWRPYHTARLAAAAGDAHGARRLELSTDACVWQNTGEDWGDVQLVLSTERASLGVEPPELDTDELRWQRKSEVIDVEARDQAVDTAGLGVEHGEAVAAGARELPGIDDGGEPMVRRAPQRASIPSDGCPWRVRLDRLETEAEVEWVAYPELTPCVIVKSTQTHRGERPLLAGPVDLVRDSGFVGRTSVLFIAPGERFELGWGPDPDLRVHREVDESLERSRALSSWYTSTREVTVRLSNLGPDAKRLEVTERVPISEIEQVKVALRANDTTGGVAPDGDGFVTWRVELPPRGREKLTLAYQLKRHESVVGL